jgi:exodeoxyribonuclease VII large subunit
MISLFDEKDSETAEGKQWTVSQLSTALRQHIEKDFSCVWVCGEISGYKKHSSGHHYFTLKDQESVIDAVCWKSTYLSSPLAEGLHVLCQGKITTYAGRSKYQIIVQNVQYQGEGALLLQLEQLKKKLTEEGLFQSDRKKPLPLFPQRIGIITSATGSVIQDILHRIEDRMPTFIYLYPSAVQGSSAVIELISGLSKLQALAIPPDVIIIARGGGSIEDLWPFQQESLARAVAACSIPVISAVGHETDTTLIDYVADIRAPTPTAAAEFAVKTKEYWRDQVSQTLGQLELLTFHIWEMKARLLDQCTHQLEKTFYRFESLQQRLDDYEDRLTMGLLKILQQKKGQFQDLISSFEMKNPLKKWIQNAELLGSLQQTLLLKNPLRKWGEYQHTLAEISLKAKYSFVQMVKEYEVFLKHCGAFLKQVSHEKVLERGFALIYDDKGALIKRSDDVQLGQSVSLSFFKGKAVASITEITKE